MGKLPMSSDISGSDRDTTAKPQSASNGDAGTSKSGAQVKAASQAMPRPLPAVTVKAKGPQVMVKAKRKADDAEQSGQPPDKKPSQAAGNGQAAGSGGLAGLAAYGSGSGSDSPSAASN